MVFQFFRRLFSQPCSPALKHPAHYLQVLAKNPGPLQMLSLESVQTEGPFLYLEYAWQEDLSHAEADTVDTRLRAYIACAIFDACRAAHVNCRPGPPHGSRPSWFVGDFPVPCSLVEASFNTKEKRMCQTVGPLMMVMSPAMFTRGGAPTDELAMGFKKAFSRITV